MEKRRNKENTEGQVQEKQSEDAMQVIPSQRV